MLGFFPTDVFVFELKSLSNLFLDDYAVNRECITDPILEFDRCGHITDM